MSDDIDPRLPGMIMASRAILARFTDEAALELLDEADDKIAASDKPSQFVGATIDSRRLIMAAGLGLNQLHRHAFAACTDTFA